MTEIIMTFILMEKVIIILTGLFIKVGNCCYWHMMKKMENIIKWRMEG